MNAPTKYNQGSAALEATSAPPSLDEIADRIKSSLRDNWRLGLLVSVLVLLLGVPFAFLKGQYKFGTSAVIQVNPRFQKNLTEDVEQQFQSNSQYRQYVQQQVSTFNRLDIAKETLSRLGDSDPPAPPKSTPAVPAPEKSWKDWFIKKDLPAATPAPQGQKEYVWRKPSEPFELAAVRLSKAVFAFPIPDTYLISVNIETDSPRQIARVLNTYVDVFLERSRNEEFYGMDQRLQNLANRQSELENQLTDIQRKRAEIAQALGVTTFSERVLNPFDTLIIDGTRSLDEARRKRVQQESTVQIYVDKGNGVVLNSMVEDAVAKDFGLNTFKANLNKRRSDLITQMSGLESGHPLRQAAEAEVAEIDQELKKQTRLVAEIQRNFLKEKFVADADQAKMVERKLEDELNNVRARATEYTERYQEALGLQTSINRIERELEKIDERVNSMKLESQAPGFVRWSSKATQSNAPVSGGRMKWLLIVFVLAGASMVMVPLVMTALDRRIRYPKDLQSAVGFPLFSTLLMNGHPPTQMLAADLRMRLAVRIHKEVTDQRIRSIAFMGAKAESGVTMLIDQLSGLLRSMQLRVGIITLNQMSFSGSLIQNESALDLASYLEASVKGTLQKMPFPEHAHWCLKDESFLMNVPMLSGLRALLDHAAQHLDVVLIDSPPLLLSADAELIASDVDCAVLVARSGNCLVPDVKRAVRLLERAQPKVVSALLNGVPPNVMGHVSDDIRSLKGLPPRPDWILTVRSILNDPMLMSVMFNAWWFTHDAQIKAWLKKLCPDFLVRWVNKWKR